MSTGHSAHCKLWSNTFPSADRSPLSGVLLKKSLIKKFAGKISIFHYKINDFKETKFLFKILCFFLSRKK
jgi:hypothetical protein